MTDPRRHVWVVLVLVGAMTAGVAAVVSFGLPEDEPAPQTAPPPERRPPPKPAVRAVAPESHLLWDPAADEAADRGSAVPVAAGDEFRVSSELDDKAVAAAVLDASQRALPLTLRLLGGDPRPQRAPYEVRVMRTRDGVKDAGRRLGWTPPESLLGFADLSGGRIWLTSDDLDMSDDVLAVAGPGCALTFVAAHEAAHQVAARCIPGAGGGAEWLCEGLAEFIGERVVLETYPGTDVSAIPWFCESMQACKDLLREERLPTPTEIFDGRLQGLDDGTRYAVHWAFFRFLNEWSQHDRLRSLIDEVRRLPWSPQLTSQIGGLVDSVWKVDQRTELTAEFRRYVAAFAPQWWCAGDRFEVSGTTWTQVGGTLQGCIAWRAARAGRTDYRIRGAFQILQRGDAIGEVVLARTSDDTVYVGFDGDKGVGVWVSGDGRGDRGAPLAYASDVRPVVGRRTDFDIQVTTHAIRVSVGGRRVLDWDPGGRDVTGAWGVDCARFSNSTSPMSSAVIWYDVRLE